MDCGGGSGDSVFTDSTVPSAIPAVGGAPVSDSSMDNELVTLQQPVRIETKNRL